MALGDAQKPCGMADWPDSPPLGSHTGQAHGTMRQSARQPCSASNWVVLTTNVITNLFFQTNCCRFQSTWTYSLPHPWLLTMEGDRSIGFMGWDMSNFGTSLFYLPHLYWQTVGACVEWVLEMLDQQETLDQQEWTMQRSFYVELNSLTRLHLPEILVSRLSRVAGRDLKCATS